MFKYAKKSVANTASKIKGAAAKQADDLEGIDPTTYARRWWILGALCLTLLGVMLANSSMNMALPKMAIDLNLAQLDLTWAELSDRSPYAALVRAGRMPELVSSSEVERAMVEPPSDTRAYVRGRLAGERAASVGAVDWTWVLLGSGRRRVRLDDPFGGTAVDVEAAGGLDGYLNARL